MRETWSTPNCGRTISSAAERDQLAAFNFVLDDVLEGGVNSSLGLDGHGKSLSFLLLGLTVDIATTKPLAAAE